MTLSQLQGLFVDNSSYYTWAIYLETQFK